MKLIFKRLEGISLSKVISNKEKDKKEINYKHMRYHI
jgi:hypothetical protein